MRRAWPLALLLALPSLAVQIAGPTPRIEADAVEYYAHLRSLYFDHDVEFTNEFRHFGILERWDKTEPTVTGYRRTNFSVGPALAWLPFYAAGDALARLAGRVEDGYSPFHVRAVALGSLAYAVVGALLLVPLLRERWPAVTGWTVLVLFHGTFLSWYAAHDPLVSHAPSFFAAALVLRLWWPGHRTLGLGRASALGAAIGLATDIRWQGAVLLLLPAWTLLVQADRRGTLRAAGATAGAFALAVLPQLLVFEAIFGVYLLPYPVQGRDYLLLDRPALLETFFSSRHGLLFWTPILWAGIVGLLGLALRASRTFLPLAVLFAVVSWVNACSGDWWGGGGFGNRRFDAVLPALAFGLAAVLDALRRATARRPHAVLLAALALVALWNGLLMEQYRRELVPRDDTVSFPAVAETNAALLAEAVGSPVAWPANWIFAARHDLPVAQYDLAVGKYLFHRQNNLGGVLAVGERDPHADEALLGEGWSVRTVCADAICRALDGNRARIFAPLYLPEPLRVAVRAQGLGRLRLAVNGRAVAEWVLDGALSDRVVDVPAGRWRKELNELTLERDVAGRALVDRVTFTRGRQ